MGAYCRDESAWKWDFADFAVMQQTRGNCALIVWLTAIRLDESEKITSRGREKTSRVSFYFLECLMLSFDYFFSKHSLAINKIKIIMRFSNSSIRRATLPKFLILYRYLQSDRENYAPLWQDFWRDIYIYSLFKANSSIKLSQSEFACMISHEFPQ